MKTKLLGGLAATAMAAAIVVALPVTARGGSVVAECIPAAATMINICYDYGY